MDHQHLYGDVFEEIEALKRERNAVIMAHYYQDELIQDSADFIGDSLELARRAQEVDADVILLSAVRFMGEVAKIINPRKTVLIPDADAGCSLESSCLPKDFEAFRQRYPGSLAVTYINCSVEIKALSDIIVTSSNAESIIRQLPPDQPIIFAPDQHLGRWLMRKTGREMILWPGSCIVHEQFSERELVRLKGTYPEADVIAHPECPEYILGYADFIGSTTRLLNYTMESQKRQFIVLTEFNILHQMKKYSPEKEFIVALGSDGSCNCSYCPYMAKNSPEKIANALRYGKPSIEIEESLRQRAYRPLEKMLELSPRFTPTVKKVS